MVHPKTLAMLCSLARQQPADCGQGPASAPPPSLAQHCHLAGLQARPFPALQENMHLAASGVGPVAIACAAAALAGGAACWSAPRARAARTSRLRCGRPHQPLVLCRCLPPLIGKASICSEHSADVMLLAASKLRKEVAQLEAALAEGRLAARRQLFERFTLGQQADGGAAGGRPLGMDAQQLREALLEMSGTEVSLGQAARVLREHDGDGDGLLRLHEFADDGVLRSLSRALSEDREAAAAAECRARRAAAERRAVQREAESRKRLLSSLPPPNRDASWPVRLCALMPYTLLLLDGLRLFGPAAAAWHAPAAYAAAAALYSQMPPELCEALPLLRPLLLMGMSSLAVQRCLPELLRFNLNQAFVLDLLLLAAYGASRACCWLCELAAGEDALYVPAAAQPATLPGCDAALAALAICAAYCTACTLAGQLPSGIPMVSAEAARSLGTFGSEPDGYGAEADGEGCSSGNEGDSKGPASGVHREGLPRSTFGAHSTPDGFRD